jgi:hypothetical protein
MLRFYTRTRKFTLDKTKTLLANTGWFFKGDLMQGFLQIFTEKVFSSVGTNLLILRDVTISTFFDYSLP